MPWCIDFTDDEGGSAETTRDKNIIGMYRRRGSNSPLLCDPGWVVYLVVLEDGGQWRRRQKKPIMGRRKRERNLTAQISRPSQELSAEGGPTIPRWSLLTCLWRRPPPWLSFSSCSRNSRRICCSGCTDRAVRMHGAARRQATSHRDGHEDERKPELICTQQHNLVRP